MLEKSNNLFTTNTKHKARLAGYIFMAPTLIILGAFMILPIFIALLLAFSKIQLLGEFSYSFRGLKNFVRMTNDERVWIALKNTAEYVAVVVPSQTIIALGLALILNTNLKGKSWFKIILKVMALDVLLFL